MYVELDSWIVLTDIILVRTKPKHGSISTVIGEWEIEEGRNDVRELAGGVIHFSALPAEPALFCLEQEQDTVTNDNQSTGEYPKDIM